MLARAAALEEIIVVAIAFAGDQEDDECLPRMSLPFGLK